MANTNLPCTHPSPIQTPQDESVCTICGLVLLHSRITVDYGQCQATTFTILSTARNHPLETFRIRVKDLTGTEEKSVPNDIVSTIIGSIGHIDHSPRLLHTIKHTLKSLGLTAYYDHVHQIAYRMGSPRIMVSPSDIETLIGDYVELQRHVPKLLGSLNCINYIVHRLLEVNEIDPVYEMVISDKTKRQYDRLWVEILMAMAPK